MFSIPMKGSLSISLLNSNKFRIGFFYDELSPGFTLIWDNVGKMVMTAHRNSRRQNKMVLWALSLAAENRIFTSHGRQKREKSSGHSSGGIHPHGKGHIGNKDEDDNNCVPNFSGRGAIFSREF